MTQEEEHEEEEKEEAKKTGDVGRGVGGRRRRTATSKV